MKVDKGFVMELKQEVNFQLYRIKRQINFKGANDGLLQSLYLMKRLKELLNGLLEEGEVVLTEFVHQRDLVHRDDFAHQKEDDNQRKQSWLQKWLRAVIRDEGD